ncbi:cytochrome P450 [Clohesyomyces aquaticus]|uniref:Cytochrome P450 n=1 Tax=Clohesyomyces aquaticus TaxID=1231657 RepID=A0A1Y1Y822_9PLEO|nr:cytochrome P450 [Clohesyomyces aquaticus]
MGFVHFIAVGVGILAHQGVFIRGEWHLRGPYVVLLHLTVLFVSVGLTGNLQTPLYHGALYLFGLFGSMVIYRIFFHRLRKFPGPTGAAVSKLWHVWKCRNSQNHLVLESLYKTYGQFVRTGPNEITIFHPAAYEAMDGAGNTNSRSEWYDIIHPRTSPIFSRKPQDHLERRQAWQHALSSKAINDYVPRIRKQVAALEDLIANAKSEPVVVNDIMQWFAHDSMGEFAFNENFGMMKSGAWHKIVAQQRAGLSLLGPMSTVIWLIRLGFALFPFAPGVKAWNAMIGFCDECMDKRLKTKVAEPDIASYFIQDIKKNAHKLNAAAQKNLLSGNAASVIIGGSDTAGPSLIIIFYLLALHPEYAEKVYEELRDLPAPYDIQTLSTLDVLNAVLNESMRVLPAALTTGTRITGPGGLHLDKTFIPPDTKISAPRYIISRMECAFDKPTEYIPERWYSRPELIKDKRAFSPFGVGRRACVGKNLGLTQIRLAVANLISKYRFRFAPGVHVASIEADMKDQMTAQMGRYSLIFEKR